MGGSGIMRGHGRRTVSVAAAVVAVTIGSAATVFASPGGMASAPVTPAPVTTLPNTSPSPCVPRPTSFDLETVAATSITFRYGTYCHERLQVRLYTADLREIGRDFTGGDLSGTLTFSGLTPSTRYFYAYGVNFTNPDSSVGEVLRGPVDTLDEGAEPAPACVASMTLLSRWGTGFTASVVVRSVAASPVGWRATWNWPGGQRLEHAYNAVAGGTPASPVLTGAAWNERLAPGESITVVLAGTGAATDAVPAVHCSAA